MILKKQHAAHHDVGCFDIGDTRFRPLVMPGVLRGRMQAPIEARIVTVQSGVGARK